MHCAITVCDREGTVVYMNERSRDTFNKNNIGCCDGFISVD